VPERSRGYAHRVDIVAKPAQVWEALTDAKLVSQWHGPGARVKPRTGGSYVLYPEAGMEREAHIDVFEPPRRIRLIYMHPPKMPPYDGAIVDDFLLEPDPEGTVVRLLGSGVPDGKLWDPYFVKLRTSSERALARLKVLVERRAKAAAAPP
jgi:uncharacterized protein YndB with AHSA1/START domain